MSKDNMVFVFGSNLAGIHGAGAALWAKQNKGATQGVGIGRTGQAYAIPTKDHNIRTMRLEDIEPHVKVFLDYARNHMHEQFNVTAIGCGLAGYTPAQIAPMFKDAPYNCWFDQRFDEILDRLNLEPIGFGKRPPLPTDKNGIDCIDGWADP